MADSTNSDSDVPIAPRILSRSGANWPTSGMRGHDHWPPPNRQSSGDRERNMNEGIEYRAGAIHSAIERYPEEIPALLDAGADVNEQGYSGETPLHQLISL